MKTKFLRAVSAAALIAASSAAAILALPSSAYAADQKLSHAVGDDLLDAQTAAQKKDFKTALADAQKAMTRAGRTEFDTYKINQFLTFIDATLGDIPGAAAAAEAAADSPAMPDSDKITVTHTALVLALNLQHFDKAAQYAKTLQDANAPMDAATTASVIQAYYLGGKLDEAKAMAQKAVDATPAGQRPDHNILQILMSVEAQQKDEANAEKTLEMLAVDYGNPLDWQQMIDVAFSTPGLRDVDGLYLGRLMFVTGAPVSQLDGNLIAATANHLTFYGDELTAVAKGGKAVEGAEAKAAADKASMADQIAAGDNQNGQYNAKVAEALYGYGRFADAETVARKAITKGGAADPSEPQMVLGMALVGEGKYADAIQAFDQVTPPPDAPALPRIVRLWKGYAQFKSAPAASATAAAPAAQPN